ncbi:hypothetical protein AB0I39_01445 [Kitasatospora purpeofusca]|uniref:hypothetical protein n=1 Tax=Kitasatospora purpeofusca TaxID=67352 RepID=UPI00340DCFEE
MLTTPRAAVAPTVTGRSYARRVASLTSGSGRVSAGVWVQEAQGVERRRRAVACRIGRLTRTRAPRWGGEIGEQDWRTVLAAGAAALAEADAPGTVAGKEPVRCTKCGVRLNRANTSTLCQPCRTTANAGHEVKQAPGGERPGARREHLADTAREFTREGVGTRGSDVVDRTRNGRVESLVDELLAARPASVLDVVGEDERRAVERWSPFRGGPRHVVRCADGSRRYGTGEPAPEH